jgi:D-alanyl-D-alanine carboxypeptidase
MPSQPRSVVLAAALVVATAALAAACGGSDRATSHTTVKAPPPAASASRSATTAARRTLGWELRQVIAAGSPGAIALVNDGHAVRLHAAGIADKRSGRAMRPTDRFRAGSITKSFVATVALQLVGEGKLSLSDTVERWLPGILPYGSRVTLRQLLNHTSGVPDMREPVVALEQYKGDVMRSWSPRELVALVAGKKPDFAAGTAFNYSNTGYVLAGLIIERVTGHRLGRELAQRLFAPLHLRDTSFPLNESAVAGRHASGYALLEGQLRDVTALNPSGAWAAGALVSTAGDIAHFWRALLGGMLLAPAQLTAMKSTVTTRKGFPLRSGLGILKFESACGALWGNGGDIAGYSSLFQNSDDGRRQAGVVITVGPPPRVVGEPLGGTKQAAISDALDSRKPC